MSHRAVPVPPPALLRRVLPLALPLAPSLVLTTACVGGRLDPGADVGGGELGVTAGGSQDMGYARELIEAGLLPGLDDWSAEGLFSEHDLPLSGDPCDRLLCPRAAASTLPADRRMLVQVGFGTDIDADTWQRRPLNMAIAVDVSQSMADGKLSAVKTALRRLRPS